MYDNCTMSWLLKQKTFKIDIVTDYTVAVTIISIPLELNFSNFDATQLIDFFMDLQRPEIPMNSNLSC
jgi:hypothetical protein